MRIYAETNFVLELVLEQEQYDACVELLRRAESGDFVLALPAFCLFEPYTTIRRRQLDRQELHDRLQRELRQISRTQAFAQEVSASSLPALLVRSTQEAASHFDSVLERLLRATNVLPLTAAVLADARTMKSAYGLSLPDAIVLASVRADLSRTRTPSFFLNRNTKDFDDPAIVADLAALDCRVLGSFRDGLQYVLSRSPSS